MISKRRKKIKSILLETGNSSRVKELKGGSLGGKLSSLLAGSRAAEREGWGSRSSKCLHDQLD